MLILGSDFFRGVSPTQVRDVLSMFDFEMMPIDVLFESYDCAQWLHPDIALDHEALPKISACFRVVNNMVIIESVAKDGEPVGPAEQWETTVVLRTMICYVAAIIIWRNPRCLVDGMTRQ